MSCILIVLHIISSDYVESKLNLLHTLVGAEYSFMTVIYNEVDCLVKSFQSSLQQKQLLKTTITDILGLWFLL